MTDDQFKIDTINSAIAAREQEIAMYTLNITNYEASIVAIDAGEHDQDPDVVEAMVDHRNRLVKLLKTEKIERAKSQLILDSLRKLSIT